MNTSDTIQKRNFALVSRRGARLRTVLLASVMLPVSSGMVLAQTPGAVAVPTSPATPSSGTVPIAVTPGGLQAAAPVKPAPVSAASAGKASAAGGKAQISAMPITPASTPQDAVKVLLQQANYWRGQYQPAQAVDALNRVLQIEPRNPDALAMLAQVQGDRGDMQSANYALARLKADHPGDPRIPGISETLRVGVVDPSQLGQARSLAKEGRATDAVSQYQRIFKGSTPTPGLTTEYYSVMSGTDTGWDSARAGLAKQVVANPQDLRAQLAYAKLLTYREQTRAEGMTRLNQLAANPATAADANAALRQAMLWLPANGSSVNTLQTYLQRHPDDSEIAQHLEAARHPSATGPQDVSGEIRVQGFANLNHGRLDRAASQFESALSRDPNDGDAIGGLGLVRLRQGRTAEARKLLNRAIQVEPGKRRQWQAALAGANTGGGQAVGREWDEVRHLADQGNYSAAEAKLRPLLGPNQSNTGGLLLLGDIQQRAGQLPDAETTYRTVLGRQPANSAAIVGLAGVLSHEGRTAEADQLFARAESMGVRAVGQARAEELRLRAEEVSDPSARAGLYRAAIAVDPQNPWLKLELARLLARTGRLPEARAVMAGVGEGGHPTQDQIRAGLLFANETNDAATATALIARVPAKLRTAEMQRAVAEAQVKGEIIAALQLYYVNRPMARERLLALAATPDNDGVHGTDVARAFLQLGDKNGAREAIATAMAANRAPSSAAKLAYSGVLLDAGQTAAAAAIVANTTDTRGLAPAQRTALTDLQAGIAVRSSDQLNNQGRTADAYDQLAPALAQTPDNPSLNMALGRLYATNNQPGQALAINEALLRQDPNNLEVRRAAVNAAIQIGSYDKADRLVKDALQVTPNDPQVWVMSADLAKARGNAGRALHDYQVARELRRQQLAGVDMGSMASSSPVGGAPMMPMLPANSQAPNILTAPMRGPSYPTQSDSPTPLDTPRRSGRTSERDEPRRRQTAEGEPEGAVDDRENFAPVRLAEDLLPSAELAQEDLPYYVSRAPQIAPSAAASQDAGVAGPGYGAPTYPSAYAPPPAYPVNAYQSSGYPVSYPAPAPVYAAPVNAAPVYAAPAYPAAQADQYANPFRPMPATGAALVATPGDVPGILGGAAYAPPAPPADPLSQDIDQNIATLRDQVAPKAQAGVGIRFRTGDAGLGRLTEEFVPLSAQFSPGIGSVELQVTPTFLQAGTINNNPAARARFGSLPLYALSANTPSPGSQSANGVGLDVAYGWEWVRVDIGTTPVGFREENVLGGIELAPQIAPDYRLRLVGERRAVTDSVLSYAGTQDPRTGQSFGGVTRTRGHAQIEYGATGLNLYAGGGYAGLDGENVRSNNEYEFGAGGSYPVYRGVNDEVRVGVDLVYFGYDHNEQFFTLGYGGYFSPQSYFAALLPVTYRQTIGPLNWSVGGSIGFQTFTADSEPVFANSGLESQLATLARRVPAIQLNYGRTNDVDFAGGLQSEVEYKLTPAITVGGRAGVQHTGNFTEGGGLVYARYTFGA